jgi:hypothetical protein
VTLVSGAIVIGPENRLSPQFGQVPIAPKMK